MGFGENPPGQCVAAVTTNPAKRYDHADAEQAPMPRDRRELMLGHIPKHRGSSRVPTRILGPVDYFITSSTRQNFPGVEVLEKSVDSHMDGSGVNHTQAKLRISALSPAR